MTLVPIITMSLVLASMTFVLVTSVKDKGEFMISVATLDKDVLVMGASPISSRSSKMITNLRQYDFTFC